MINIAKASSISSDYKDRLRAPEWSSLLFAKVVFLDKSNPSVKPRLYQLKDSALSDTPPDLLKGTAFSFSHDAFILLGEVNVLDKTKKKIELTNKNFVSYTHLVIVSGAKIETSFHEAEFTAGLQTLVDALRVMPIVPNPYEHSGGKEKGHKAQLKTPQENSNSHIESVVHPFMIHAGENGATSSLSASTRRLYEVQL